MTGNFIAINITTYDRIFNNDGYPIIFYWDGESDMIKDIKNDPDFYNIVKDNCLNRSNNYTGSFLKIIYVNNFGDHISHKEETIPIQDLYPLEKIEDSYLWIGHVFSILTNLYKDVYKKDFVNSESYNKTLLIPYLYKEIRACTNKDLSNDTITNYIMMELNDSGEFSQRNIRYIINYLKNIQ